MFINVQNVALKNNCVEKDNLSRALTLAEDLILAVIDILSIGNEFSLPYLPVEKKDLQKQNPSSSAKKNSPISCLHHQKWRQFVRIDAPVNLNFCGWTGKTKKCSTDVLEHSQMGKIAPIKGNDRFLTF